MRLNTKESLWAVWSELLYRAYARNKPIAGDKPFLWTEKVDSIPPNERRTVSYEIEEGYRGYLRGFYFASSSTSGRVRVSCDDGAYTYSQTMPPLGLITLGYIGMQDLELEPPQIFDNKVVAEFINNDSPSHDFYIILWGWLRPREYFEGWSPEYLKGLPPETI